MQNWPELWLPLKGNIQNEDRDERPPFCFNYHRDKWNVIAFTEKQLFATLQGERTIPICLRNQKNGPKTSSRMWSFPLKTEVMGMGGTWWHDSWEGIVKSSGSKSPQMKNWRTKIKIKIGSSKPLCDHSNYSQN